MRNLTAHLWDTATGRQLQVVAGPSADEAWVALSAEGRKALTGAWDRTATLWDAATGEKLHRFEGHPTSQTSALIVALSADAGRVLTGAGFTAMLWDGATGKLIRTFPGPDQGVSSLAISSDGGKVFIGSRDGTVMLWNAAASR